MPQVAHVAHLHRVARRRRVREPDAAVGQRGEAVRAVGAVEADVEGVRVRADGGGQGARLEGCATVSLADVRFDARLAVREEVEVGRLPCGTGPMRCLDGDDAIVNCLDVLRRNVSSTRYCPRFIWPYDG